MLDFMIVMVVDWLLAMARLRFCFVLFCLFVLFVCFFFFFLVNHDILTN